MIRALAVAALGWLAAATAGAACEAVIHRDRAFTVCTADRDRHAIDLRLNGADGTPLGSFVELQRQTEAPIAFAMNGGMYHPDRRPVGLYVEDGVQLSGIVTREGPGNFGMLPNGVFCIAADGARVIESRAYAAAPPDCEDATQSGPMLVIDGALHPRFLPDSEFLNLRNGVGAAPDGRAVHFVISDEPVSFYEMATLFRDVLGVRDALYLDGRVSRLYAPALGRADPGRQMGPILVVTER
ncbi:phosphodiester glycosidase family protein [Jannaschia ovalis]|uniref:Phosphodiester glycosidase family protein n=1 Tax=Jannaschia ovalis TaxID=3038773 RepID=A0ABY8LI25_9RHOB|nr:phosphodiester glycosidase family protein [Jannaschia sp. GRR-S6-38]WGH79805.1 phosphodiester glycosidase family protein [Jannaschia sp. GRR-S6-38]